MGLFSASEMANLVQLASQVFTDTCTIWRIPAGASRTKDGRGGYTDGFSASATGVPCAVLDDGIGAQEPFQLGQARGRIPKTIALPAFTDIRDKDKIETSAGIYYEVLDAVDPTSYEVIRRVIVLRLGQGATL